MRSIVSTVLIAVGWLGAAPLQAATLAAAAPPAAAKSSPAANWLGTLAEAQSQARASGRLVFVDLYAEWCGWCKQLESKVFSTPRFREYAAPRFVLLRVDTEDRAEGTQLQARYGAETLPTTLVLTADGVLVAKVGGFAPTEQFIDKIDVQLANWKALDARYATLVASSDKSAVRQGAEALHERGDGPRAAALYRRLVELGGMNANEAAWTTYLLADALHQAGELAAADTEIARARAALDGGAAAAALLERLDLLAIRVAEARGNCKERLATLESFLRAHPASQYSAPARRTLQALKSDGGAACS